MPIGKPSPGTASVRFDQNLRLCFLNPHWFWLNRFGAGLAAVDSSAARETANDANGHVVVAVDLATEPSTGYLAGTQAILFGLGHPRRFTGDELDAASGAFRVTAAGVKLILAGVLHQGQNQAFSLGNRELANTFNSQNGHGFTFNSS
jgi:hypothetical protein